MKIYGQLIFLSVPVLVFTQFFIVSYVFFYLLVHGRLDLFKLVVLFSPEPAVRTAGMTPFSDPALYHSDVALSDKQIDQYFEEGYTVVRGAFPVETITRLRDILFQKFGLSNAIWSHMRVFDSDELHDFYVYSSLGPITAQIFKAGNNKNDTEDPSVYLWREFQYVRHPSVILSQWHVDAEDCDFPYLSPRNTDLVRPRLWVPLDNNIDAPLLITNKMLDDESLLEEEQKEKYLRLGHVLNDSNLQKHIDNVSHWWADEIDAGNTSSLPHIPNLHRGDLLIHSGCVLHRSPRPDPNEKDFKFILFATYTSGRAPYLSDHLMLSRARDCAPSNSDPQTVEATSCFFQAYPEKKRARPGTVQHIKRKGDYTHWVRGSVDLNGTESLGGVHIAWPAEF